MSKIEFDISTNKDDLLDQSNTEVASENSTDAQANADEISIEKNVKDKTKVKIETSIAGFIDEEALLPGAMEPKDFKGYLENLSYNFDDNGTVQFKPLTEQDKLIDLQLSSHGQALYYELNDDRNELTAKQGANGCLVFKAVIDNKGLYTFTLYSQIDRESQSNLITNGNFESTQYLNRAQDSYLVIPGWEIHKHISANSIHSEYKQNVPTQKDHLYQVTFYYSANKASDTEIYPIEVFWDDSKLITLDQAKTGSHGYTFSVLGNQQDTSKLRLVCQDEEIVRQFVSNISVVSRAQSTVPIVLALILMSIDEDIIESDIKINVTTTPPLEFDNQSPMDIVFEQSIYQTIVISDENIGSDPFAKLNLNSIFESLAVSNDERLVQIVQRESDGVPTNVYEVQVTDKSHAFHPITVADVQLSFPGGDAGLSVFLKNIQIDEI